MSGQAREDTPRCGTVTGPGRVKAWDLAVLTRWAGPSVPNTPIKETSAIEKQRKEVRSAWPHWKGQIARSGDAQVGLWGTDPAQHSRNFLALVRLAWRADKCQTV